MTLRRQSRDLAGQPVQVEASAERKIDPCRQVQFAPALLGDLHQIECRVGLLEAGDPRRQGVGHLLSDQARGVLLKLVAIAFGHRRRQFGSQPAGRFTEARLGRGNVLEVLVMTQEPQRAALDQALAFEHHLQLQLGRDPVVQRLDVTPQQRQFEHVAGRDVAAHDLVRCG